MSNNPNQKNENEIKPWEHGFPLYDIERDLTHLAERIAKTFKRTTLEPFGLGGHSSFSPKVDVREDEDYVVAMIELPGMTANDIEVTVSDATFVLRGEKKSEETTQDRKFYRIERSFGSFERHLSLPCDVKSDQSEAVFKNGVLKVTMPKSAAAKSSEKKLVIKNL